MKCDQRTWTRQCGWIPESAGPLARSAQLVLVFGATTALQDPGVAESIRTDYPVAHILGCSTAGEICGAEVHDDSVVATAIHFEHTQVRMAHVDRDAGSDSRQAGELLAHTLPHSIGAEGTDTELRLAHVLVLSDGLSVNASDLVRGLTQSLPAGVAVTGGLAGDGARFSETLVFRGGVPEKGAIAAVGLYGSRLIVGFGSLGGGLAFGPERLVTRATGNVLFELDGRPALGLYKQYLGEHAKGLPATGLLFPLSVRAKPGDTPLVRTVLAVDEQQQSMTFAGDIPQGAHARLTRTNVERLVNGAIGAARTSCPAGAVSSELAILISCVGRKLVLKQRVEEEVEGVRSILGEQAVLAGFYSYGEIAPFSLGERSALHNQTMTVTTFAESS
ncbi:MAG: FIST C-terminal domain-containing protein [Pseudomonadota bacterium]|nr:FIST C-terminal domain-containing protein [Pseudomonadota bacterium]